MCRRHVCRGVLQAHVALCKVLEHCPGGTLFGLGAHVRKDVHRRYGCLALREGDAVVLAAVSAT
eukprot:12926866-Prorocentrum_lima.AAC.1